MPAWTSATLRPAAASTKPVRPADPVMVREYRNQMTRGSRNIAIAPSIAAPDAPLASPSRPGAASAASASGPPSDDTATPKKARGDIGRRAALPAGAGCGGLPPN